jgi:hypothetical protein
VLLQTYADELSYVSDGSYNRVKFISSRVDKCPRELSPDYSGRRRDERERVARRLRVWNLKRCGIY